MVVMRHLLIIALLLIVGCAGVESEPVTITQEFSYTATGDDGIVDQAAMVQIRMAQTQDSLVSYWDACSIVIETVPWAPTVNDTLTVQITIETGVTYYFAIKIADEIPNWSGLSNVVILTFPDVTGPSPIGDFDAVN